MKIEILDEAGQDLLEGFRFYEPQSEGLGGDQTQQIGCFVITHRGRVSDAGAGVGGR